MSISVTTNHHWHDFLYGYDLTKEETEEFDYIDPEEMADRQFIRYRGILYDTHEFVPTSLSVGMPKEIKQWDVYSSDTFFSGILIRYSRDSEQYQVATYIS